MNRQQDLFTDLPRGEQLKLLRRVELEPWQRRSMKVSGMMQKAVLRVIDDHDGGRGCFASQNSIAATIGCGRATVARAIAALIDRDLITKERPNHWSPNHHRINWTALGMLDNLCGDTSAHPSGTSTCRGDTSVESLENTKRITGEQPLYPSGTGNANEPIKETPTNRPSELSDQWAAVVKELFSWGLKSAMSSIVIAQRRGLSIEYVRELWIESGGNREPTRFEPGQLANWLTGNKPAPFDESEAMRRIESRRSSQASEAERIRETVNADGIAAGVPQWVVAGTTWRRLRDAGIVSHATDAEVEAAKKMDVIDKTKRCGMSGIGTLV